MLLKFGARNFASFKEGIEISLEYGNKCPISISKGKKIANLLCIKGANGSGKTNVLKIIAFIGDFCSQSFQNKPENKIPVDSFFLNEEPTDIFCEFEVGGVHYYYEATITNEEVISEILSRKRKKNITVFKRTKNKLSFCISEFKDLENIKLRSNASIICTAHQYEIDNILEIYEFFMGIKCNVGWGGRFEMISDVNWIAEFYEDFPEIFEFVKSLIRKCDLGIEDIKIESVEDEKGTKKYFPIFKHKTDSKKKWLHYVYQSSGTKALFQILLWYKLILDNGGVLGLDEFDISFHPDILPVLVQLFEEPELNNKDAQMIFTTHNTKIMDEMGKYRTVLINQESSESYGYRLDEIPGDILRNDRSIAAVYKSGKIGGVPKI